MAPLALLALAYVIATASAVFTPKKSDELAFAAVGHDVWIVNIKTKENLTLGNVIVKYASQCVVDEELFYWADPSDHSINSVKWDGTSRTVIKRVQTNDYDPNGLAVDRAANFMCYGLMLECTIICMDMTGKIQQRHTLPWLYPSQLQFDRSKKLIFYAYVGQDSGIARMGYDGKERKTLVATAGRESYLLCLTDDRIYWAKRNADLMSSKEDGTDIKKETTGQTVTSIGPRGTILGSWKDLNQMKTDGSKSTILRAPDDIDGLSVYTPTKIGTSDEQKPGSQKVDENSVQSLMKWSPKIHCLKTTSGTVMKIAKGDNLGKYSLIVMKAPEGCSKDLGELTKDITVPEPCISNEAVEVAVQLTDTKNVLGGNLFRHFRFSCTGLGSDGKVQVVSTDNNLRQLPPTAFTGTYADGKLSMFVTTDDVTSSTRLTPSSLLNVSQENAYLVIQHSLGEGSPHRTLIPRQCDAFSSSHADKMSLWTSMPGEDCVQHSNLLGNWTVQPHRPNSSDATYASIFPFNFKPGEKIMLKCSLHECPGVQKASDLKGSCKKSFDKFEECGGRFQNQGTLKKERRSGGGASRHDRSSDQPVATRLVSATFTLV